MEAWPLVNLLEKKQNTTTWNLLSEWDICNSFMSKKATCYAIGTKSFYFSKVYFPYIKANNWHLVQQIDICKCNAMYTVCSSAGGIECAWIFCSCFLTAVMLESTSSERYCYLSNGLHPKSQKICFGVFKWQWLLSCIQQTSKGNFQMNNSALTSTVLLG